MKVTPVILALSLFALFPNHAFSQASSSQYALTVNHYPETVDIAAMAVAEFGPGAEVADWDDIKANFAGNVKQFCDDIGLLNYQDSAMCLRAGSRWYGTTRQYFIERHDGNPPVGFLAHDEIDNYMLSLGSWYNITKRILVKIPDSIQLTMNNLASGQVAVATVTGAGPVSPLVIAYSFSGGGPTQTGFGFSLDLTLPILKTPIMLADLSGTLVIHQMVPTSIPTGTPIWFQAIEIRASGSPPQLDCVLSPGLALTVL